MFRLLQIYLSQFGYLNPQVRNPSSGTIIAADAMKKAIVEFQVFAGLNITGNGSRDSIVPTAATLEGICVCLCARSVRSPEAESTEGFVMCSGRRNCVRKWNYNGRGSGLGLGPTGHMKGRSTGHPTDAITGPVVTDSG
jgi:hypothetical protein